MRRIIAYFGLVLAVIVVGFWGVKYLAPTDTSGRQAVAPSPAPAIGGAFNLVDHNRKSVTDIDFRGRYLLVFFGYTFCPDLCPTTLHIVTEAMDLLGAQATKVQPIFISVDPERDTPETLKSFVENFHPRLIGLTGSSDQVAAAAKAYRVYYAKANDEEEYLMDHSAIIYLMGLDGKFVTHFSHGTTPDTMAAKVREHL